LDAQGSERAEDAYVDFSDTTAALVTAVHQMERLIESQAITETTASVRGRLCLDELKARCIVACDALAELLPGSGQADQARDCGYTNHHMGAILIGDGFSLYGYLQTCDQILQQRKDDVLWEVADRQILAEIDNYHNKLEIFCDVMRDLGLFDAMMKARHFAQMEHPEDDLQSIWASSKTISGTVRARIQKPSRMTSN
jgi:hypothetical protein